MDRRSLLALFKRRPRLAAVALGQNELPPDEIYQAARKIRGRIDAALATSRLHALLPKP